MSANEHRHSVGPPVWPRIRNSAPFTPISATRLTETQILGSVPSKIERLMECTRTWRPGCSYTNTDYFCCIPTIEFSLFASTSESGSSCSYGLRSPPISEENKLPLWLILYRAGSRICQCINLRSWLTWCPPLGVSSDAVQRRLVSLPSSIRFWN